MGTFTERSGRPPAAALLRLAALTCALLALGATHATAAVLPQLPDLASGQLCLLKGPGEKCALGLGIHSAECVGCVTHVDWPPITGVRWQVTEDSTAGHHIVIGSTGNDELLGRHGSDTIAGGSGDDILWGDSQARNNNTFQRDAIYGGPGSDWIYASHGYNSVVAGPGNDRIIGYFGHGKIDCGPGRDTVTIPHHGHRFRLKSCEIIRHPGH